VIPVECSVSLANILVMVLSGMTASDFGTCRWIEGDALDLPFTDCYFDAVTVGYGLRNVVDKSRAMQEIFRVLKPGSVQVPNFVPVYTC
jgi:demethylmenaquinone methyltransferase/2-methoxy-6-polyprenyl-1,4-benzoquinol methylase